MTTVSRLSLPTVTLCAATSVNLKATVEALRRCLAHASFADCLLFTDDRFEIDDPAIRKVTVKRMRSSSAYSHFMLHDLADHLQTDHVLVVQWDGFILNPQCWDERFLDFDYIGAPWPQFDDGHDVGNGGFSLRSKRLLEACRDERLVSGHPEDVAIARTNRPRLETEHGIRFAPRHVAERFAFERGQATGPTFGFHGVFNMIDSLGAETFWDIYRLLDDRGTALSNYSTVARQLGLAKVSPKRRIEIFLSRLFR